MSEKLYSAAEIAAMNLPGLPATSVNVRARAKTEGWYFETTVGLGGTRKLYRVPSVYLSGSNTDTAEAKSNDTAKSQSPVRGAIAGGQTVDSNRLASAIRALDEFLDAHGLEIPDPEKKAEIVTFLYKYLEKRASSEEISDLLKLIAS